MGDVRAVEAKTEVLLIKKVGTTQKKLSPFIYFGLLPFLLLIVVMLFAGLADGTVNAATDSPEVRVGSELEFPPYAFVDKSGQPAGFSVDLIKAVAGVMGLPIKISTGPWDTVWKELVAGRLDVLPIVAKSPERRHLVDFSLAHTETYDAFFVREGNPSIQNIEAARGKEIVVMRSDAAHHALLERNFQGRLILVETIPVGLSLIASGKHDAFLCSKLIGTMVIQEYGLRNLAAGPLIPDYKRVFSFAVKKGDTELLEKLNQGLLIIKTTHEYDRIYEKWLTADDPWRKWQKYLWPTIIIVITSALIAGFWLVMLQRLVKKRTRQLSESNEMLRRAQEGLEERVSQRTAELTKANVALQSEITERQRAEEALRESEDRFRKIFDNAATGIAITDWEGHFQHCNPAYCALLSYTEEELRRIGFASLIHPEDREADLAEIRRLQAGELPFFEVENRYVRQDGQPIWVHKFVSVLPDATGKPAHLVALVTDITGRKRTHDKLEGRVAERTADLRHTVEQLQGEVEERLRTAEDLKESEERYRLLAENVMDLIWTTDMNIELTFVSPSMKPLLGFTPEEAIELGTKKLLTPASYELAENTLHEEISLESQEPVDLTKSRVIEIELIHKEGFTVWAEVKFTFLRDQDGHPVGLVGVTRDITERKRAGEVLKESEKKLRNLTSQLLTAQEEERKRLSRELHDSLGQTLLVLKLQMRATEKKLRPDQQTLRQESQQTLRQIDRIIEDVRRLARNLSPSVLDDFGLPVALRNMCEEFSRHQNLKLSLDMDDISGSFSPEAQSHIYRFFQESLTNIGKHARASRVSLAIKRRDGGVAFFIEDDGIGFQLEEAQARDGVERAMGLATMAERVRILGGELQISSKPGTGTRISFIIPEGPQI